MPTEKRKTAIGNPLAEPRQPAEIVLVKWRDSCYEDGYDSPDSAWAHIEMYTVGFLMRDDADGVVLGMEQNDNAEDKRFRHVISIPRSVVDRMVHLRESGQYGERELEAIMRGR